MRRELKARAKNWDLRAPERESVERDAKRINEYLHDELRPSSNGAAIFACSAADGFFEAAQFDAPIEENQLFTSYRPTVYPLARLKRRSTASLACVIRPAASVTMIASLIALKVEANKACARRAPASISPCPLSACSSNAARLERSFWFATGDIFDASIGIPQLSSQ